MRALMKISSCISGYKYFLVLTLVLTFPAISFAEDAISALAPDLKHHFIGYFAIAVTFLAYAIAMTEDLHQMSKAKPMVLGSAIIWFAIFIYFSVQYGTAKNVAANFQ
jgi:hypothetical protein